MTAFWIIIGCVSLGVSFCILQALLRTDPAQRQTRDKFDLAIYKDQLSELERDLHRGLLTKQECNAARTEIERRILTTTISKMPGIKTVQTKRIGMQVHFSISLAVLIPAAALTLYFFLGSPEIPNVPYAYRDIPAETRKLAKERNLQEIRGLVARLETSLSKVPNNIKAWLLLGRSYAALDRTVDAVNALKEAHDLYPNDPEILIQYAEYLIVAENNRITGQTKNIFNQALQSNPRHFKARYYLALAKAQANDIRGAIQDWVDLIAISPQNAAGLDIVKSQINAAASELRIDPNNFKPSREAVALGPAQPLKIPI